MYDNLGPVISAHIFEKLKKKKRTHRFVKPIDPWPG